MGEPEIKIGGKFILGRKLGAGSFGEIFLGIYYILYIYIYIAINVMSGEQVALKLVHIHSEMNILGASKE